MSAEETRLLPVIQYWPLLNIYRNNTFQGFVDSYIQKDDIKACSSNPVTYCIPSVGGQPTHSNTRPSTGETYACTL